VTTDPALSVRDLTVRYGGVVALDAVSFDAPAGAIVGLIGPNGAGKTTLIDALTGFTRPAEGHIEVDGRSLAGVPPHGRARAGLARTFQSLELFDDLTVRENLLVAASTPTWRSTLTDVLRPKRHTSDHTDAVLAQLGLTERADRLPADLSNGERHLVALGRGLVARPRLLLLDEPAAGLDTSETAELREVIRALPAQGITVLLVDHDMALILDVCTTVVVLDFGRVIAEGPPAAIRSDPAVLAAYLGGVTG